MHIGTSALLGSQRSLLQTQVLKQSLSNVSFDLDSIFGQQIGQTDSSDRGVPQSLRLYHSHYIISNSTMRTNTYTILDVKPQGKMSLGRPRCRWKDNIKKTL
jgi:hypothetical protein